MIAARRLREGWLLKWWRDKYNRPSKDPLLLEYTWEELMTEYLEDLIQKHPEEAYVTRDGEGVRFKSGDAWFDDLDERIAHGESVSLEDMGLSKEICDIIRASAPKADPPATAATASPSKSSQDTKPVDAPFEETEDTYAK